MKFRTLILIVLWLGKAPLLGQVVATENFSGDCLRLDLVHSGDTLHETYALLKKKKQSFWERNQASDLAPDEGSYRLTMLDSVSGTPLFTTGYSTLFEEWQALPGSNQPPVAFFESVRIPFPDKPVRIRIEKRTRQQAFVPLAEWGIDPEDPAISMEKPSGAQARDIQIAGKPESKLDLVFLPEGYTRHQKRKFRRDCRAMIRAITKTEPYASVEDRINFRRVDSWSDQSGADDPGKAIWVNTRLGASFNTLGFERYLTLLDIPGMQDLAALVPCDLILVLVNSNEYGGCGFYNQYALSTTDHPLSAHIALHEIGHALAGLADEYYSPDDPMRSFYDTSIEPWEANITSLVAFDKKWPDLLTPGVPVPTPNTDQFAKTTGVFEGAGYRETGLYRPAPDCLMKSFSGAPFCKVCQNQILQRILNFSD